jgi:hypothetical protein
MIKNNTSPTHNVKVCINKKKKEREKMLYEDVGDAEVLLCHFNGLARVLDRGLGFQ